MNRKTLWIIMLFCFMLLAFTQFNSFPASKESNASADPIKGEAALLADYDTGKVLYAKNEHKKLYPASTTKILTALLAIKYGDLSEQVQVGKEVHQKIPGESTAWLHEGQILTLEELQEGLMLPSGNDAARTIAIHIAKKQLPDKQVSNQEAMNHFVSMMNEHAKKYGAGDSHFTNPSGLHDEQHYSTASDLAAIAMEAQKYPEFQKIVARSSYTGPTVSYENTNKLLDSASSYYFEGSNGIKTGYTEEAGYCLISSAERNGKKMLTVILKSTKNEVWSDSIALLNKGFSTAQ